LEGEKQKIKGRAIEKRRRVKTDEYLSFIIIVWLWWLREISTEVGLILCNTDAVGRTGADRGCAAGAAITHAPRARATADMRRLKIVSHPAAGTGD